MSTARATASNTVVSKTLIVKDNVGLLPEDELASHYCLQVPGWCPHVNCHDFSPPSVSLLAKDNAKDNLCGFNRESYHLILKRKESATTSAVNIVGEGIKVAKQAQVHDTPRDVPAVLDKPGKRFQFDCHSDDLQKFKEEECPANTAKSNKWALRNFETW